MLVSSFECDHPHVISNLRGAREKKGLKVLYMYDYRIEKILNTLAQDKSHLRIISLALYSLQILMKRSPQGDKLYPSNSALSTVLGYVSQIDDKFAPCFVAEMVGNDIIDAYR